MSTPSRPAAHGFVPSGSLAEHPLPELFREIYERGLSGGLQLVREKEQRVVFFVEGQVKSALSNLKRQKLGQHLLGRNAVDEEAVTRAVGRMAPGLRVGKLLVEDGALTSGDLDRHMEDLIREIVYGAFEWQDGKYNFIVSADPVAADIRLDVSTADIILEACRRLPDPAVIERGLGPVTRVLQLNDNPLFRFQHATLSPNEGFIMSRVDGVTPLGALLKLIPLPAAETRRGLFALLSCGILRERGSAAPRPDEGPSSPLNVEVMGARSAARMTTAAPGGGSAGVPSRADLDESDARRGLRRRRIQELYSKLEELSYYELLGCPRRATQKEIRLHYLNLSAQYHPDLHLKQGYGDMKDKLKAIFARLEEAYETLVDADRRQLYDRRVY